VTVLHFYRSTRKLGRLRLIEKYAARIAKPLNYCYFTPPFIFILFRSTARCDAPVSFTGCKVFSLLQFIPFAKSLCGLDAAADDNLHGASFRTFESGKNLLRKHARAERQLVRNGYGYFTSNLCVIAIRKCARCIR